MTPFVILAIFAFNLPLPLILQLVLAAVLPLLVGLVTKRVTGSHVKALLLLGLSLVTSGVTDLLTAVKADQVFDLGLWVISAATTFGIGVIAHFGLWKPTGATDTVQNALGGGQARDAQGRFVSVTAEPTDGPVDSEITADRVIQPLPDRD